MMVGRRAIVAALAAAVMGPSGAHCAGAPSAFGERAVAGADSSGTGWSLEAIELDVDDVSLQRSAAVEPVRVRFSPVVPAQD